MDEVSAGDDFERALLKGFWRRVENWLLGRPSELLSFHEVRQRLPLRGQRDLGLQQVRVDAIIGSVGRWRDFDRAFFPTGAATRDRWIAISRARYADVGLPPVELYRLGEVYFVKDGNHRVSVARERGQPVVDAYVTEIDVPLPLTRDTEPGDLELAEERLEFARATGLAAEGQGVKPAGGELLARHPGLELQTAVPGHYRKLLGHLEAHRFYLAEKRDAPLSADDALLSFFEEVYLPIAHLVQDEGIRRAFAGWTELDLYLWITQYQDFLRAASREDPEAPARRARRRLRSAVGLAVVRRLARRLSRPKIQQRLLEIARALFLSQTRLGELRPGAEFRATLPHTFARLFEHIGAHRWYLGVQLSAPIPYAVAVLDWYDQVYAPLVAWIREEGILGQMPGRTETDLFLWIQERQELLRTDPSELPLGQALEELAPAPEEGPLEKMLETLQDLGEELQERIGH